MPQIVVDLTDAQYNRAKVAIAKHVGLMTETENRSDRRQRDATNAELAAFLTEHLRQMVRMVERESAVVSEF